ncbi:hypothetical protein ATH50_1214 [Haloplanus aerogenes]|uniref:DUF7837 domain-containing protein n=1 Tax=Haloplanus aerogenes TaxID=660522 RepID=A0A3M0DQQ3_9EURY|nr:hypothetical protein ATH50_1214 [Haloplanus aerogenes]
MCLAAVGAGGAWVTRFEDTLRSPMSSTLGDCPRCDARISTARLLIEYDTSDGPAAYAECPGCRDVVHPA